ncbi:flagellar export chaperone FlgN [Alkalibacter mobilis]|uniref:flagellar export chaperone FlgN n=1 Tax=Alkalibacter mobilis TaxID=2787712 RepID=UPI00189D9C8E|nr:flagellar export chaperone FlgN [Alkalibacter mobilis]MBF7096336.1 flagellar export chaperone FlgN [Alkalibacter mobilis]
MSRIKDLVEILQELLKILREEKQILIKNDALTLVSIVERKNILMDHLEKFQNLEFEPTDEMRKLVAQIDSCQETNQMLTFQALSYQEEIFKALSKNNTSKFNTYSSKGYLNNQRDVSILDQSV